MIRRGQLWVGMRDCGLSCLCWDPYVKGQATVIRAACPSGRFLESNSPLHPKQDDLMTTGRSWDRQGPFPTDVHNPQRTKTELCVVFTPLFQEVSWELELQGTCGLALRGPLGTGTQANLGLRPAGAWSLGLGSALAHW